MELVSLKKISIKNHPELDEKWVQARIAEDPSILGLGNLILKDKERYIKPGFLDLLLQDEESTQRYEVEIQLGAVDESHIIRTIEYWDIEKKRYPQYEHTAVVIAEEITSRFLNVISLFNGTIPIVAIQMSALKVEDKIGLVFIKVIDQMSLGVVDGDEDIQETTRAFWESKSAPAIVKLADELLELAKQCDASLELKYNKFYIGLAKHGKPNNFIICRPKRQSIRVEIKIKESPETRAFLEDAGLLVVDYNYARGLGGCYRIELKLGEIEEHKEILSAVVRAAFDEAHGRPSNFPPENSIA